MRLTLVISSLQCGGAERVMTLISNYWADQGSKITLLTLDDDSAAPFYDIDNRIHHIPLGIARVSRNRLSGLKNNIRRVSVLRRAIRASDPKVVLSFMSQTNIITLLATRGLTVPVIVSERVDPAMNQIGSVWEMLRWATYKRATSIVLQSNRAKAYFRPGLQSKSYVIPNPVLRPPAPRVSSRRSQNPLLLAVGRLDAQKGFDILLEAFALLKDRFPEWTLKIFGEGPQRRQLEELRLKLGLKERVFLPGTVRDLSEQYRQADLFVLSSRFEGFPNVLCEAMSYGVPAISANCSTGPSEIIRNEVDGLLVPSENVAALAGAMARLMADQSERKRLSLRAVEIADRFNVEKIMRMWGAVLCKQNLGELEESTQPELFAQRSHF